MRFLFDVRITSISDSVVSVTLVEEINWIRFSKEHNSLMIRHSGLVGESMSQLRSPSIMMSFLSIAASEYLDVKSLATLARGTSGGL